MTSETSGDEPVVDLVPYGSGKDDSTGDTAENASVTEHNVTINGKSISYMAHAGHLVTADPNSALPAAKIFYVAFTANDAGSSPRPVTFFYNGGPGSSSVFLLLGSFGPRRIKTAMPYFTPPAPYTLEDNPHSLLDHSDLVFINPVGTGYSVAVAPNKNKDFWGVDEDARCVKQFIKRYLTVFKRWNSPKFLFGESYGTPRTCVLSWLLHEDGVDLNGVILQSAILDYSKSGNPVGLLPTLAADAWVHDKVTLSPRPADLGSFLDQHVIPFARSQYQSVLKHYAQTREVEPKVLKLLGDILGMHPVLLQNWQLDVSTRDASAFLTSLLQDEGRAVGSYDGRVSAVDTGIAGSVDPNSGGNDPTMTAVGGVYTAMWNVYLNEELQYTSASPFTDLNDQAFLNWNFGHVDPTGAEKGGRNSLYTAGDLAASMALNPYLKVFVANGYYDAVTPFFQTVLDLEEMPLVTPQLRDNLTLSYYESGHMVYLDNASRARMKNELATFYDAGARPSSPAATGIAQARVAGQGTGDLIQSQYRRRFNRTPY
ncbi:MAG: peptidase S1 [Mycobacterium sp.]|uniref:S10 family peptidase n=2 Tax=Mycobacterium sp. TaxID=1785 RepID=UPI003BB67E09